VWNINNGQTLGTNLWQLAANGRVESFNGKFRDECLNTHWFTTLRQARSIVENGRADYNKVRPHSALGYPTPKQNSASFDTTAKPRQGNPSGSLRSALTGPRRRVRCNQHERRRKLPTKPVSTGIPGYGWNHFHGQVNLYCIDHLTLRSQST
jgi:hypothetical protein